jgi:TM2 domain-containing membrane protein YozV
MDEPSEIMGSKHRMYRHDPYNTPKEARLLFGEYADEACLDHILLDRRSSEAKGWQVDRPSKQTVMHPIALLFFALVFSVLGFQMTYINYVGWFFAIWLWVMALLCFLGFLGTMTTKKEKEPTVLYKLEMPPQYFAPKSEDDKQKEENTSQNKNDG